MSASLPASSGWDIRQSNRILANGIGGNKAERRPWAGKEWLAATEHDGVDVKSILINQAKVGQALCQLRSGNGNLANEPGLQTAHHPLDVIRNKRRIGADGLQR